MKPVGEFVAPAAVVFGSRETRNTARAALWGDREHRVEVGCETDDEIFLLGLEAVRGPLQCGVGSNRVAARSQGVFATSQRVASRSDPHDCIG